MGDYTEVLLTCSASDGYITIGELNIKLSESGMMLLEECLPDAFPKTVWGAYQKNMPISDFANLAGEQEWELPGSVQVFARGEHDEKFSEIEVNLREKPPRRQRWTSATLAIKPGDKHASRRESGEPGQIE